MILALSLFAAARGPGVLHALEAPVPALELTLLAVCVTACAMASGWLLARPFGREVGLSGMFAGGARNVLVAWAAVAPGLDAVGTMFMTLTVIPMYLLPEAMRRIVGWSRRGLPAPRPTPAVG